MFVNGYEIESKFYVFWLCESIVERNGKVEKGIEKEEWMVFINIFIL